MEKIIQFVKALQIEGCNVQVGTLSTVKFLLTPENVQKCIKLHPGDDLFFLGGVDPKIGSKRAGDKDILKKNHIFIDIDLRKLEHELTDEEIKEQAKHFIEVFRGHSFLGNWCYVVFTGNGLHFYYLAKEAVTIKSMELWKRGMESILMEVKKLSSIEPDTGCTNPARLCRLPGSKNHKNGGATLVEFINSQDVFVDMSCIEKLGSKMQSSIPNKPELAEGGVIKEGARNTTLTKFAGLLRRHGLTEEAIYQSISTSNKLGCNPALPENEVAGIAKGISGRYKPSLTPKGKIIEPILVNLSSVKREEVEWLWQDRIPLGKLTLIEGDPGAGKSWASLALACAVTTGAPLPMGEKRKPARALLLAAEDDPGDTIKPRFEDMGGDDSRIDILQGVCDKGKERHISLTEDVALVDEILEGKDYDLVIVDPINAYIGSEIDSHKDTSIRAVLTPLTLLASRRNVALICIRHLTKSSKGKSIYRGQGSIAYIAAARVAHIVGINPHNKSERVIACHKNNLAPHPPSLAFETLEGRFYWKGETDVTPDDLVDNYSEGDKRTAKDDAKDFLKDILSDGPKSVSEIEKLSDDAGIKWRTLERAKIAIGIESNKKGFGKDSHFEWKLPKSANFTNGEDLASFD